MLHDRKMPYAMVPFRSRSARSIDRYGLKGCSAYRYTGYVTLYICMLMFDVLFSEVLF